MALYVFIPGNLHKDLEVQYVLHSNSVSLALSEFGTNVDVNEIRVLIPEISMAEAQ